MKETLKILTLVFLLVACTSRHEKNQKLVEANPFLTGTWKGEGKFFNASLNESFGPVPFRIVISEDNISGKVGDAMLTKTIISKASYGFEIKGVLDANLKIDKDLDRKHLIILLVMPEGNLDSVKYSDANFHLKNNYFFDFAMQVGGVELRKEP
jgi:hypothetical protein